jgi:hypothetical protein
MISSAFLGAALRTISKTRRGTQVLCNAGLKVNAEKSTFCALEIELLGYILIRDGIKPQSNKVQAILAIQPPTNVKELRHFLGMAQYSVTSGQDIAKCLPLSPQWLESAVRSKSQEPKGPKRCPGIGMRSIKKSFQSH